MKRSLTRVSVGVSSEAEEAIVALFERIFGQPGTSYTDAKTNKTHVTIYLERRWTDALHKELKAGIAELKEFGLQVGTGKISTATIQKEDWAESWKKHFKPITVGRALLIRPSCSKLKPARNQAVVTIDPGLSFGTGQHATTSFCLQQLVACRNVNLKQSFLDIGTGSGILAISAARLGYDSVNAFDFDPESVRVAKENATNNGVESLVQITRKDLTKMPLHSPRKFHVICANLIYDLLIQEAGRISNRLAPGGQLILAGILRTQFKDVQDAYEQRGFKLARTKVEKEWQSGRFTYGS